MKVFFNYLALTVALALGFSSCSSDDDLVGNGTNPIPTGKATTFTLSIAQPRTYAADPNATTDETKVNSVDVFIFSDADVYEKTDRLNGSDFSISNDNEYTANKTIATTVGPKKIYVGVNLPEEVAEKVASQGLSVIYNVNNANDLMESTNGFAMFSKVASNATFVEDDAPTAETANKVSATVSRLLAKVSVQQSVSDYNVTGGKVSDLHFSVSNITTLYYILPNLSTFSPINGLSDLYNEDNYKGVNANGTSIESLKVSYALENASATSLQGYSTYASIRGKFLPTNVVKLTVPADGSSKLVKDTAPSTPQTFYTVPNALGVINYFTSQADAVAYDAFINSGASKLKTYTEGNTFYKAYLNPAGDYNIFRNNVYKVNITKINGLGDPADIVDTPDKEVSKPTNIDVNIDVESWTENIQDSELG